MSQAIDTYPLHRVRMLELPLSTTQVATLLRKSRRWVTNNKNEFKIISEGRSLKYEFTSVYEYYLKQELT